MNSKSIKVFSSTLRKEVSFDINDIKGPKHSSIEKVFYDECEPSGAKIKLTHVSTDVTHPVVMAEITDGKRTVVSTGECTPNTLNTEIARNNPSCIAFNRAFDRAVLRFLGLYDMYAESENVDQKEKLQSAFSTPQQTVINGSQTPQNGTTPQFTGQQASNDVIIMTENEEWEQLKHTTCMLKKYQNGSGETFAPFGWIAKYYPGDIKEFIRINANMDLNAMSITDPDRAKNLRNLYRFLELNAKKKVYVLDVPF